MLSNVRSLVASLAALGVAALTPAVVQAATTGNAPAAAVTSPHRADGHHAHGKSTRKAGRHAKGAIAAGDGDARAIDPSDKRDDAAAHEHAAARAPKGMAREAKTHDGEPSLETLRAIKRDTGASHDKADKADKADRPEKKRDAISEPPKPSTTPLPTIAATIGAPLAAPIATDARDARHEAKKIEAGHAIEPRRTPTRVSTSTRAPKKAKPPCLRDPIEVSRGGEEETFPLTKCDGSVAPLAVESLSILVRPGSVTKPASPTDDLAKGKGADVAPGIKRVDPRLVEKLQAIVDHFAKPGVTPKVFVVSGYRPSSAGSFHANGRALDFRLDGVKNDELVAFCKTLPDTGCGFYPNSSFVHVDVRDAGTGHVSWIDASSPGETPKYVASWPSPGASGVATSAEDAEKADDADAPQKANADADDVRDPVHALAQIGSELQLLPPASHDADAAPKRRKAGDAPAVMIEKEIGADPKN